MYEKFLSGRRKKAWERMEVESCQFLLLTKSSLASPFPVECHILSFRWLFNVYCSPKEGFWLAAKFLCRLWQYVWKGGSAAAIQNEKQWTLHCHWNWWGGCFNFQDSSNHHSFRLHQLDLQCEQDGTSCCWVSLENHFWDHQVAKEIYLSDELI